MPLKSVLGRRAVLTAAALALVVALPLTASAETIFTDDFESADFQHSENGFKWSGTNSTSIVRDDGYVVNNGKAIMNGPHPDRDWENAPESSGRHAMRFRYAAGSNMSEQRFSLGGAYPEIWMSFWLRVPINFQHGSTNPSNNKLFRIWMDTYTNADSKAGMEFRSDGAGGSGFYMKAGTSFGDIGSTQFIRYPSDQGRWMQLVIRVKANSAPKSGDGVFQVWRRWEGELDFEQTHDQSNYNIEIPSGGPAGFTQGYLMGWANTTYAKDTEFLIDDFVVSTTNLLESVVGPRPPTAVSVE